MILLFKHKQIQKIFAYLTIILSSAIFALPATAITHEEADEALSAYLSDGISLPVDDINPQNYGYEYAQPWTKNGTQWETGPFSTLHPGLDINTSSDCGRKVKAVSNGIVRFSGYWGDGLGGVILLQHRNSSNNDQSEKYTSQYGHIAPLDSIKHGDYVYRGQHIAYIARGDGPSSPLTCDEKSYSGVTDVSKYDVGDGKNKNELSEHLHFEIRSEISLSATTWPKVPEDIINSKDGDQRKRHMDNLGYLLPYTTPYAQEHYPEALHSSAIRQFQVNTNDNADVQSLSLPGIWNYTPSENRPTRNSENYVLTKSQVVELIGRVLYSRIKESSPNDPIQYAIDNKIIDSGSKNREDFQQPVTRDIVAIMIARSLANLSYGLDSIEHWMNIHKGEPKPFTDIEKSNIAFKYIAFLKNNNQLEEMDNSQENGKFYPKMYATEAFVARLLAKLNKASVSQWAGQTRANSQTQHNSTNLTNYSAQSNSSNTRRNRNILFNNSRIYRGSHTRSRNRPSQSRNLTRSRVASSRYGRRNASRNHRSSRQIAMRSTPSSRNRVNRRSRASRNATRYNRSRTVSRNRVATSSRYSRRSANRRTYRSSRYAVAKSNTRNRNRRAYRNRSSRYVYRSNRVVRSRGRVSSRYNRRANNKAVARSSRRNVARSYSRNRSRGNRRGYRRV